MIDKLSRDKIRAKPQPVPLDLSNWDEIGSKKPPFIFFTGHRDFKLTDQEVKNLGEYLRSGGCIWGDSSLPGQRSRFDIAFRRAIEAEEGRAELLAAWATPDNERVHLDPLGVPEVHKPVKFGTRRTQPLSLPSEARLRRHSEQSPQRVQRWLWLLLLPSHPWGL